MITLTIHAILNSMDIINEMMEQKLSGRTAFHVARIARELNKEYEIFEKTRYKLIEKYSVRADDGKLKIENNTYHIDEKYIDKFNQELSELLNSTVELNIEKIALKDLEHLEFTPKQMYALEAFIEE